LTSLYDACLKGAITPKMISVSTCLMSLGLSQIFSLSNGEYFMQIFDKYAVTLPLLIITFFELLAINWYWGMKRVADDIHLMCGRRPSFFFLLCWRYITPTLMFLLFIGSVVSVIHDGGQKYFRWHSELGESIEHILPTWAQFLCGIVAALSTLSIPIILIATKLGCCKIEFNFVEEDFVSEHALNKLRHKHNVEFYTPNRFERWILLMKSDASEATGGGGGSSSSNSAFRYPPTRQVSSTDQPGKIEDGYDSANELTIGSMTSEMHGFLTENLYGKAVTNVQKDAIKLKVKRPSLVDAFPPTIVESSTACSSNTSSSPAQVVNKNKTPTTSGNSAAVHILKRQGSSVEDADISSPASSNNSTLNSSRNLTPNRKQDFVVHVDLHDKAA